MTTTGTLPKGLHLSVLSPADLQPSDRTLSSRVKRITLVGIVDQTRDARSKDAESLDRTFQVFSASDAAPAYVLVARTLFGGRTPHLYLTPADVNGTGGGYVIKSDAAGPTMASGNYGGTPDARWTALLQSFGLPFSYPLPLHDYTETWAEYERMD